MTFLFITIEDITLHRGSATHIREKVSALRERGHRVILVGGSHEASDLRDFTSIGSFRNKRGIGKYLALSLMFPRIMLHIFKHASDVDVIYAREPIATLAAVITKPFHRIPIMYEVNSLENEEIKMRGNTLGVSLASSIMSFLQHIDSKFSDKLIALTERVRQYYRDRYKTPDSRFALVGVTADPSKFSPMNDTPALNRVRTSLNIDEGDSLITFIGNLSHWQDLELLLKAARIVLKKSERARFLIIGDGAQKQWLDEALARESFGSRVLALGSVPHQEVVLYINISDVCIAVCKELVSGYSPMKLFEYLACGKPIVATRVAGYEVVEQAGAGKLIRCGDADQFASELLTLTENGDLRRRYGENALRFARDNFGWSHVARKIEESAREIVALRHPS